MSNEELALLIRAGDREKMIELWSRVERFVCCQAEKRARALNGRGGVTAEDLCQSGFLAMIAAVNTFDPAAGKSFIGWLAVYLKTEFAQAAGYRSKKRDALDFAESIEAPVPGTDDLDLGDTLEDLEAAADFQAVEDRLNNEQLHNALEAPLNDLPLEQGAALRGRYYRGQTLGQLAQAMGTSQERVRGLIKNGLAKIRRGKYSRSLEAFIELRTPYYAHVGVETFCTTWTSATELAVFERERLRQG